MLTANHDSFSTQTAFHRQIFLFGLYLKTPINTMELLITLIILLYSAILHEIAHGYVADRFGDPTARLAGRLTLNPKSHIDLFMSILLPLSLLLSGSPVIFGGAKPVPIDPFNLKEGRKDVALVSLSGPLTNVLLAIAASILYRIFPFSDLFSAILLKIVDLNLLLAIFNLLPIPPLDGSKIFALLLSERQAASYLAIGTFGMFIIYFLLLFPFAGFSLSDLMLSLFTFSKNLLLP